MLTVQLADYFLSCDRHGPTGVEARLVGSMAHNTIGQDSSGPLMVSFSSVNSNNLPNRY